MSTIHQVLIVLGGLILLKPAMILLCKTYTLPTALYFAATRLFWPEWAAANKLLCGMLFAATVLFFVIAWCLRYVLKKQREQQILNKMLATATYWDVQKVE